MKIISIEARKAEYDKYLAEHIQGVQDAFAMVKDSLDCSGSTVAEAAIQISHHDESKYLEDEYFAYLDHFYPADGYEIPEGDKDIPFDLAWLNHQHRNKHHWQHWILVRDGGEVVSMDMPEACVLEMLCDWHSFSRKDPTSTAKSWWEANNDKMVLSDATRELVEKHIVHFDSALGGN